ncbi:MAG: hypothetical protein JSV59_10455, partial [Flavobacteriaceae bacterium]
LAIFLFFHGLGGNVLEPIFVIILAGGFGLFFMTVGSGIGAITAIFKKPKTFSIEGKHSNLKAFQEAMDE